MKEGQVVEQGSADLIFKQPQHQYTQALSKQRSTGSKLNSLRQQLFIEFNRCFRHTQPAFVAKSVINIKEFAMGFSGKKILIVELPVSSLSHQALLKPVIVKVLNLPLPIKTKSLKAV